MGKSWDHIRLILGHSGYVGTFWAMLAPYWAMLSHFSGILWFLLAFVGQELGPFWAYLGPFWVMLGHFGQRWHRIGLMLSHFSGILWFVGPYFGPCWDILSHVGTIFGYFFGKSWDHIRPILGHFGYVGTFWATLAPYWAHVGPFCAIFGSVSAFVLDLGISVSLNFRPCKAFAQNTQNTNKKYNLWTPLLMVFAAIFLCFFLGACCS